MKYKGLYVKHAFINNLHHYLTIWWDDEDGCWQVGIAALPSKKKAYRMATGVWGKFDEIAHTSNSKCGVRPAWFLKQLDVVINQIQLAFKDTYMGGFDLRACAVDNQRHGIYKWALGKRGWLEHHDGEQSYMLKTIPVGVECSCDYC